MAVKDFTEKLGDKLYKRIEKIADAIGEKEGMNGYIHCYEITLFLSAMKLKTIGNYPDLPKEYKKKFGVYKEISETLIKLALSEKPRKEKK